MKALEAVCDGLVDEVAGMIAATPEQRRALSYAEAEMRNRLASIDTATPTKAPQPEPVAEEYHTLLAAGFDEYTARCALRAESDGGFCHAYFYSDGDWRFQTGGKDLTIDGRTVRCVLTKRLYAHPVAAEPVGLREAATRYDQAILDHQIEGPYYQYRQTPDWVGSCKCGETFFADSSGDARRKWAMHVSEVLATPARTDDAGVVRVLNGANSHCFDMRIIIGDGDANEHRSDAECIAFANEPWASRIAAALSPAQDATPDADRGEGLREALARLLEWWPEGSESGRYDKGGSFADDIRFARAALSQREA